MNASRHTTQELMKSRFQNPRQRGNLNLSKVKNQFQSHCLRLQVMKFDETLLYQMTLLILSLPMKLAFTYIPYFTKSSGTDMFLHCTFEMH